MITGDKISLKKIILESFLWRLFMKNKVSLCIKYESQVYQIDVDTLVVSLLHFSELTSAVSKELIPAGEIKLKIEATEKGSFVVILEAVKGIIGGLFDFLTNEKETIDSIHKVINTILDLLSLKRFLGGKKPESIKFENGNVVLEKDGAKIVVNQTVYRIYCKNSKVNFHIEKMFESLSENLEVDGFSVVTNKGGTFHANREEFYKLAADNEITESEKIREVKEKVRLTVVKVVFQKNRKWDFIYEGNKISAYIADEGFWNKVGSSLFCVGKSLYQKMSYG
ncbi:hypothetical protein, partial [Desulfofundulus sp.]|uniref:hypothetical protein n=1 Tax=Desulfofundulus sp. TaxID=2282750 RepID=UPI003C736729